MLLKIGTFQLLQALFNATKPFRNKTVTIVRLRTPFITIDFKTNRCIYNTILLNQNSCTVYCIQIL